MNDCIVVYHKNMNDWIVVSHKNMNNCIVVYHENMKDCTIQSFMLWWLTTIQSFMFLWLTTILSFKFLWLTTMQSFMFLWLTTIQSFMFFWLATGQWFSLGPPVSSTNKTDCHNIAEILLKVALKYPKSIKSNRSGRCVQHYVIKFVSDLHQVGFPIGCWNCFDSVVFFIFRFIQQLDNITTTQLNCLFVLFVW
jgi:hypothetical protein